MNKHVGKVLRNGFIYKVVGKDFVASQYVCPTCHRRAWHYFDRPVQPHHCHPSRQGGASVINKYG